MNDDMRTDDELKAALPAGAYVTRYDAVAAGPGWYWFSSAGQNGVGPFQTKRAALLACITGGLT